MTKELSGPRGPVFEPVDPESPVAVRCVERYYEDVSPRFGVRVTREEYPNPPAEALEPPLGVFLVARLGGEPVGCGALTTLEPGVGYLSRMWVSATARGHGVGRGLLAALETWARRLGHQRVRLYTHDSLSEAQSMYRRAGYREIDPFFEDAPFADLWFEKRLAGAPDL